MISSDGKVWRDAEADPEQVRRLANELGLPLALAAALIHRGLVTAEAIERYLSPRLDTLSDPFRLQGMTRAVRRILDAIQRRETILIYGDYDVDGITSSALVLNVISRLGGVVTPFLPNRLENGYGLSRETLMRCLRDTRPQLVVTVDCGTGSVDAVEEAARAGVDVVVTDHHEPSGSGVAPAWAVVNPKLGDDPAVQMLAGVGVAFKLCHALLKQARMEGWAVAEDIHLREYLDLVAIGTVADIVPLLHENRVLARHGLDQLNHKQSAGIRSLLNAASVKGPIDSYHIGFVLGPRINAAGRMGDPSQALELLLTEYPERAYQLAARLEASNRQRQEIEARIVQEACNRIDGFFDPGRHFGLVVAQESWHAGVIGIVASKLTAKYRRPVVVVGLDADGVGRGSCRSIENFDILKHLEACAPLLLKYGGHAMAAGLEVEGKNIEAFRRRFNEVAAESLSAADLRAILPIDAWIRLSEADDDFLKHQSRMKPFGHANPMPVWAVRGAQVVGEPCVVGTRHVRMTLKADGVKRDAIAFNTALDTVPKGPMDVAFHLQENHYRGQSSLQLNVQSLRVAR